jgi:hypothetical protein
MGNVTALFLAFVLLLIDQSLAQESIQDWSNKVIELQERQGQNFDQDLTLVKGYLLLHRRQEALSLLSQLKPLAQKKNELALKELYEAATDQFFFQETAENHAEALELIRSDRWTDAKEKLEVAIQKEPGHRQLVLRLLQVALSSNALGSASEQIKFGEEHFASEFSWRILYAWFSFRKENYKEAYRVLNPIWVSEKKKCEQEEASYLIYLKVQEMLKFSPDWSAISRIIQKNPSWLGVRIWRIKNGNLSPVEKSKELKLIQKQYVVSKAKIESEIGSKKTTPVSYFYGLVSLDSIKKEMDVLQLKISGKE